MKVGFVFAHVRIRVGGVSFYVYCICTTILVGKMFFSQRYRWLVIKFKYSPNRSQTYEVLVASPDALLLSHRRLMGGKATKLGSRDKHPAYC